MKGSTVCTASVYVLMIWAGETGSAWMSGAMAGEGGVGDTTLEGTEQSRTSRGRPWCKATRLCHSCTWCGFWRSKTLLRSRGRRLMSCSKRARRSSRSTSSGTHGEGQGSGSEGLGTQPPPSPSPLSLQPLAKCSGSSRLIPLSILHPPCWPQPELPPNHSHLTHPPAPMSSPELLPCQPLPSTKHSLPTPPLSRPSLRCILSPG